MQVNKEVGKEQTNQVEALKSENNKLIEQLEKLYKGSPEAAAKIEMLNEFKNPNINAQMLSLQNKFLKSTFNYEMSQNKGRFIPNDSPVLASNAGLGANPSTGNNAVLGANPSTEKKPHF